jgi:hypothetical protein
VQAAVVEEQLAPEPAAEPVAARTLAVLLTGNAPVSVVSALTVLRALPAPVVAGIDVARRSETRCIALLDRCLPCFGLETARVAHISKEEGCLAATRHAAQWEREEQLLKAQHLTSFLVALVQAVKASIHCCSIEDWQAS